MYVLRNGDTPPRYYTGVTSNVAKRHAAHNDGCNRHTAKYGPWAIDVINFDPYASYRTTPVEG